MPAKGPMEFATSFEPWAKELQQAVNTCGCGACLDVASAAASIVAMAAAASAAAAAPTHPPTWRYLKDSSVLRSNCSALACSWWIPASVEITSCTSTLAEWVRAVKT